MAVRGHRLQRQWKAMRDVLYHVIISLIFSYDVWSNKQHLPHTVQKSEKSLHKNTRRIKADVLAHYHQQLLDATSCSLIKASWALCSRLWGTPCVFFKMNRISSSWPQIKNWTASDDGHDSCEPHVSIVRYTTLTLQYSTHSRLP